MINKFKTNTLLKDHTTFKVGGKAEYFYQADTTENLVKAIKYARDKKIPLIVLGNGSNVLISDKGLKGLVIKNNTSQIKVLDKLTGKKDSIKLEPRYQTFDQEAIDLNNLDYNPDDYQKVDVTLDSGVTLPKAIFTLINQGITGLEWFAGIPATIGGATYINLHGADKYLSDYLVRAEILTKENKIRSVDADYFNFDYDASRLTSSKEIVLNTTLRLFKGPKEIALKIAKGWALKKSHQPQQSAGCIFQNLSSTEQKKLNLPTPSIGYLMDKKLALKGKSSGGAKISEKHAGFVVNTGNATAKDIVSLIKLMKSKAKKELDLDLKLEIVTLGFDQAV